MDEWNSQIIAEERIRQALEEGKFDNLEGAGKPLKPDGTENLPPELRMAFRVLKNAGYVPAEIAEEREITQAIELLSTMEDERERFRQMQKLEVMIMKMNERRGRPVNLEANDDYYGRIVEKVRLAEARFRKNRE
ncbi:DnaJ family domain-containing protein [Pseudodesulfovibrio sp.]|uniref:DnaJ family domain-containing protein n=1 Tax=unclassified Pseudodesulfovibrio TaxID=2661612 RepID=UPI003B00A525